MIGAELMRDTERMIMLNVIDNQWKDHLLSMDHLKEGIGLRGYGQKDPLIEYKKESYTMFQDMMDRIEDETVRYLFFMQRAEAEPAADETPQNVPYPELWAPEPEEEEEPSMVSAFRRRAEVRDRSDPPHRAQEAKRTGPIAVRRRRPRRPRNNPC